MLSLISRFLCILKEWKIPLEICENFKILVWTFVELYYLKTNDQQKWKKPRKDWHNIKFGEKSKFLILCLLNLYFSFIPSILKEKKL